jgi:transposase
VITIPVTGRHDLTDTQWAMVAPLLPTGTKSGRPPKWTKRQLIDGIRDGTWTRILTGLQARADAAGLICWDRSRRNRAYLRRRKIRCTIPVEDDQAANRRKLGSKRGRPPAFDRERCKQRHAAECGRSPQVA